MHFFDGVYARACFEQAFSCARIQPCKAAAECGVTQALLLAVLFQHVHDFQFAAARRAGVGGKFGHLIVKQIQAGNGMIGNEFFGLFMQRGDVVVLIKTCHAETLWVVHLLGEDGSAVELADGGRELVAKAFTKENIVTQNQAHIIVL